jgi:hypothetical protein
MMRVFSSLAGLDSVFFFFGDALQNATQLFFNGIPQMTALGLLADLKETRKVQRAC